MREPPVEYGRLGNLEEAKVEGAGVLGPLNLLY